jgi:cytochrome c oxidase subunit IV
MASDHHIIPFNTYLKVFAALIGLTFLTVITAKGMDLSPFNGAVAFLIAATKAGLVMAIFMHLWYDAKSNSMIIFGSFAFVLLLFIFCVIDIYTRIPVDSTL